MELGADADITSAFEFDVRKLKEANKHDDKAKVLGCWMSWRFIGRCLSSKSKEDGSETKSKNKTSRGKSVARFFSFSTNNNSGTGPSTSNMNEEMNISSNLRRFTFNELKEVTRNFRAESILGQGGFGCVFKGWLSQNMMSHAKPGMGIPVAVKTLNHDGLQGHKEWLAEVSYLGELHHPNLVKLIGYCIEGDQRLLVYEFMPRGSLENHLFRRHLPLPWSIRMKIVFGAAKGLAFLHEEADRTVIFRDFKTSNILLDSDYNAKLSDFGLAKDGPEGDRTHVSTRVMGTYGYAAPEYVMTGHLTAKSDVYSFGVVLLELLTGRKAMDRTRPPCEQSLVEWARTLLVDRRRYYRLMDPQLHGHFSMRGAERAIQIACRCLSRDPKARPAMTEVVEILRPVLDLTDMVLSSPSFQAIQASKNAKRTESRTGSSSSVPSSPFRSNYALPSPSPNNGRP